MSNVIRKIRGALGNALVWGAVWFGATFAFSTAAILIVGGRLYLPGTLIASMVVGSVGALTGGTFSAYVAANFRRSGVDDLSAARVGLGGTLVATLIALILVVTLSVVDGTWPILALSDIALPVGLSAALGSMTAFSSVKLAQRAIPATEDALELQAGAQ